MVRSLDRWRLVVVEHNRVLSFPAAEFFYEGPDVAVGEIVPQGQLIPVEEESYNHGARVCRVADDGKLYIAVGQPHNVPPAGKVDMYSQLGIGGIMRMKTDGLGDEIPPGELNRTTAAGQHFGYPYWNGHYKVTGSPAALDLKDMKEPANAVYPEVEFPAHQAQLGMAFYNGKRTHEVMAVIAKPLSDQDIEDLSA